MNPLKNRHLLVAGLMAPIMALIGYFAFDIFVGETPHAAKQGRSYKLVEKPGCRYAGGKCALKNGDFELIIGIEDLDRDRSQLKVRSAFPLEGVVAALVAGKAADAEPLAMQALGRDGLNWTLTIPRPDPERHRLQLAASSQGAFYFGDAATRFRAAE